MAALVIGILWFVLVKLFLGGKSEVSDAENNVNLGKSEVDAELKYEFSEDIHSLMVLASIPSDHPMAENLKELQENV